MNVNKIGNKIYKNQLLKKGLACAADNGSLFVAGTSLALSTFVRPISILATPKTDKDNKRFACMKSIGSSVVGFALMMGVSIPVANGVKKIDKSPDKYLKPETIKSLKEKGKPLAESCAYKFATQLFKLGIGAIAAAPKSILTCLLIHPLMSVVFGGKKSNLENTKNANVRTVNKNNTDKMNNEVDKAGNNLTFKGNMKLEPLAKEMGKIIDIPAVRNFSDKFKNSNLGMHMVALTDVVSTLTFAQQTKTNKKIDEKRKKPLIYNAAISTGLSIAGSYAVDKALEKPTDKFIKNFTEANKGSELLPKYIEGIKIAKPALIMGGLYYAIIPVISTFLADRIPDKNHDKINLKIYKQIDK